MTLSHLLPFAYHPRRTQEAAARVLIWAVLLLVMAAVAGGTALAQGPENARAGIVVDFGNGAVHTACVDLGADGQATGEEVLAAAGFAVLIEYSPMGGAVCKIGNQGCDFPGQACWCQCMSSPCVYWAYNYLQDGQWVYSTAGASIRTVHAGDVEGWAWGAGSLTQGAMPPLRTFDQICAPAAPTDTPTATATPTWPPEPTDTPQSTPTWTPWPTNTPLPTPTWTPVPSPTPLAMLPTPTWTPTSTPTLTPTAGATETPTPTWTPTEALTLVPLPPATTPRQTEPLATPTTALLVTAMMPADMVSGEDTDQPQALAQVAPTDTPTPTTTPQALAAAVPVAPRPDVYRDNASSIPPRLDPSAGNSPVWPADRALLTTISPDYLALSLLALALVAMIGLARAFRRGLLQPVAIGRGLATWRPRGRALRPAPVLPPVSSRARSLPALTVRSDTSSRLLSLAIYGLTAGIGLLALLNPFVAAVIRPESGAASAVNTPLLMTVLVALCFLALLFEVQGQTVSAKIIALLGVLVAINSVLRFVEVSIPGPGGFTPIFFLIVLTGYVYGARFGFLMGALTLLVSALITGGIGPWLPGQMFTAGWMGLLAPLVWPLLRLAGGRQNSRAELVMLAVFAGLGGLFFGIVINLWFWPYMTGPADQYWQAGVGLAETVRRYAVYYLATSLLWDIFAVAGNVLLVMVFGAATLRALRRFQQRFDFEYQPEEPAAREAKTAPERSVLTPQAMGRMQRRGGESV